MKHKADTTTIAPDARKLCEASGPYGWLKEYVAPGQGTPPFGLLCARGYNGEYPTVVIGKYRCIRERHIPLLLASFGLVPIGQRVPQPDEVAA